MFARRDFMRDYMMIPPGTGEPSVANMIVEIPKGRRTKFEIDKTTGLIKMDRYLYSSTMYPGDYGFIPQTLAEDGDPSDILVMVNEPTFSGCLIEARVVGLFKMRDKGQNDYKLLAVPHKDPLFGELQRLEDVPQHFLREVEHFFSSYKQLEGATVEPLGWASHEEGANEVRASIDRFRATLGNF
jgi:inorganic pyrophosphatase